MPDAPIRLSALLAETRNTVDTVVAASIKERDDHAIVARALQLVGDTIDEDVRKACDQDIGALLVRGWSMASELRDYSDPVKYPPDRTVRMALAEHPMKITIDPELLLLVAGLPVHKLELLVEFDAQIHAAVLVIQAGAIKAFEAGRIRFDAKLSWGGVELPLDLKAREVTIPGRINLADPVVIRR
jgi:hypothetical protein